MTLHKIFQGNPLQAGTDKSGMNEALINNYNKPLDLLALWRDKFIKPARDPKTDELLGVESEMNVVLNNTIGDKYVYSGQVINCNHGKKKPFGIGRFIGENFIIEG